MTHQVFSGDDGSFLCSSLSVWRASSTYNVECVYDTLRYTKQSRIKSTCLNGWYGGTIGLCFDVSAVLAYRYGVDIACVYHPSAKCKNVL